MYPIQSFIIGPDRFITELKYRVYIEQGNGCDGNQDEGRNSTHVSGFKGSGEKNYRRING